MYSVGIRACKKKSKRVTSSTLFRKRKIATGKKEAEKEARGKTPRQRAAQNLNITLRENGINL